jgi:signal transduction histidine kinase
VTRLFRSVFPRFLLAALIPLLLLAAAAYGLFARALRGAIEDKLIAFSDGRKDAVETKVENLLGFVSARALSPSVAEAFSDFGEAFGTSGVSGSRYRGLESRYGPIFRKFLDADDWFYDILLVDKAGRVVFTLRRERDLGESVGGPLLKGSPLKDLVESVAFSLSPQVSDFDFYPPSRRPALFLAAPVFGARYLGAVVFQVREDSLFGFAGDYAGLGKTGEVVLGKRKGGSDALVAPLRFMPDAAFRLAFPHGAEFDLPLQRALEGRSGAGFSTDYRGREVLARWQYLPRLRWGMVVKQDASEILSPARRLGAITLLLVCALALAVAWAAARAVRSVVEPIRSLSLGTEAVGRGEWDIRLAMDRDDEIGDLSRAFDRMTGDLKKVTASRSALEREVSQRARAEEALLASNRELEDFAYVVSHDLKAPLRGISSLSSWLLSDCADKLDEEGRGHLALLGKKAVRMDGLINGILRYSRLHRLQEEFVRVDLDDVLDEVLDDIEVPASVRVVREARLPRALCSPTRIKQVFQNLLENALKYMDKDPGTVRVRCADKGLEWEFCVSDDGPGIEEKHFDRIFKMFQTVPVPGKEPGTGIGLALVKKAVSLHRGRVWVESRPGLGSRFYFTLPKEG